MHETTARLYQAAAELRRIYHLSELAHALAISPQTLRNWEKSGLSKKGLQEAQQVFGVSLTWLQTGKGEMLKETSATLNFLQPELPDLHAFALQRLGLHQPNICSEIVKDDNMFNTLAIGDMVLIDKDIQYYTGSGVYALHTPTGMKVYRINQFQNGFFVLINDNPAYPPEIIRLEETDSLNIMGRVVGKYGVVAL